MAFFVSDQNNLVLIHESGTYGSTSGVSGAWLGHVTTHTVSEDVGVLHVRFAGLNNRNVGRFVDGPIKVNGNFSYYPTDFRMALFALGSVVDGGSPSPYTHTAGELNSGSSSAYASGTGNPFTSFTLEETKNAVGAGNAFIRTINGCVVNSWSLNASEGQPLTCTVDYVGRIQSFSSGTSTTMADPSLRPYMWSDMTVRIPSGTLIDEVKSVNAVINNNLQTFHFVNGSRYISNPIPTGRDYSVTLTLNAKSENMKTFYDQYFIGGSTFNMLLGATASTGSRTFAWTFSGCKLTAFNAPATSDNVQVQEVTMTVLPQTSIFFSDDLEFKWGAF